MSIDEYTSTQDEHTVITQADSNHLREGLD